LTAVLQAPDAVPADFDRLGPDAFLAPEFRAIYDAIRSVGGVAGVTAAGGNARWLEKVRAATPSVVEGRVTAMAVTPLPITDAPPSSVIPGEEVDKRRDYVTGVVARLTEVVVGREIAELRARLGGLGISGGQDETAALLERLQTLEARRRVLRGDN
jgi:DNA primase